MNNRLFSLLMLLSVITLKTNAQYYDAPKNHQCLRCHSSQTYTFHNNLMDTEERKLMNPYYIIDTTALRQGVHNAFDCTDCHSYDYTTYPHNAELKLEPLSTCLDCHGGDESFADYQFEKIQEEFEKSVHYKVYGDNFTCTKCHSQHTYKPIARNSTSVMEIVDYSNKTCLSCHNDMKKFKLLADKENPQIVDIHNWLPNQEVHFQHVRCIECHTEVVDGLMVSHNILDKSQAVRKCVECHSANSKLKASLYKYQNLQMRAEDGSVLGVLSHENYVIGSHQVPFLKTLSIIIFLCVMAGIVIHGTFRFLKK